MSKGAVAANKKLKKKARQLAVLDAWFRQIDEWMALDACLITCDTCGLQQVSPGPPCVICGSETGWFKDYLPGHQTGFTLPDEPCTPDCRECSDARRCLIVYPAKQN